MCDWDKTIIQISLYFTKEKAALMHTNDNWKYKSQTTVHSSKRQILQKTEDGVKTAASSPKWRETCFSFVLFHKHVNEQS